MMRTLKNGEQRFCYGLFTAALITSAIMGVLLADAFGASLTDQMSIWGAAAVGGNLGPLLVDGVRRLAKV
jgi:hypothetical protein